MTATTPTPAEDQDARGDLEEALTAIHGIADVMTEMGKPRGANAVAHLAGTLQDAYDQAQDAFSCLFRLDGNRERSEARETIAAAGDYHVKFVSEALHLRALHNTREARNNVKFDGADAFGQPEPPDFDALTEKYDALMREWAEQRPLTGAAVYAYINLAQAIIGDEILNNAREGGGCAIVSGQRDLGYALALLGSVAKGWVNDAAVNEMIARERAEREPRP